MTDAVDTAGATAAGKIVRIRPKAPWQFLDLAELWAYRELLWVLTARDIKVRYKQTALGVTWAVIQPFMLMVVFSVFFGKLAKMPSDGVPYPVFSYAALVPWLFFSNALTTASGSVIGAGHLISKVYFPRLIIPLASVGSWLIDFFIAALILLGLMLYYGVAWSWQLLAMPLLLLGVLLAALGVGTLLAALTVAYRDFRYVVPFMLQFWMFATPVVYPTSIVPEQWRWVLHLNPMAGLIDGFRACFLGLPFDLPAIGLSMIVSAVLFVLGVAYFEKVKRRFADLM